MQGEQTLARMPWRGSPVGGSAQTDDGAPAFCSAHALLAAVAAAWAAGLGPGLIEAGLETLSADAKAA